MSGCKAFAITTALTTVLAAGAAGCATVPSGGQVASGRSVGRAEPYDDPYVRMVPVRPKQGWLPDQIVTGFLTASAGFDDQHRTAAEYLARGTVWRPDPLPSVIMYDDSTLQLVQTRTQGDRVTLEVQGTRLGSIRPDGQYEAADRKQLKETFELAKNAAGQWRIVRLPDSLVTGLLLSGRDVNRAFRSRNLYFFAPDNRVLVPNTIFQPLVNRRELPAQLVRAVLSGPTTWLKPAVRTAFPSGTRLAGEGVVVADGVATVNLSKEALKGDRAGMSAQLMWTLRQLPEVGRLKLEIDGDPAPPPGVGEVQSPRDWAHNDPDAAVGEGPHQAYLRDGSDHLSQLLADDRVLRPAVLDDDRLQHPAISLDARSVAGLNEAGDTVLTGDLAGGGPLQVALQARQRGARFTTPSWDRNGNLWAVETTPKASWLWIKQRGRPAIRISDWGLGGYEVRALRVALDGVRVAAIVRHDEHGRIEIGRIAAGAQGLTAEEFLPISAEIADAVDLAWQNAGQLAVLGRAKGKSTQQLPYTVPISGGSVQPIGNAVPADMQSIAAAPDSPVLIGATVPVENRPGQTAERVCRLQDPRDQFSAWQCPVAGAAPAYPG